MRVRGGVAHTEGEDDQRVPAVGVLRSARRLVCRRCTCFGRHVGGRCRCTRCRLACYGCRVLQMSCRRPPSWPKVPPPTPRPASSWHALRASCRTPHPCLGPCSRFVRCSRRSCQCSCCCQLPGPRRHQ
jgi:hypothetical protein